jgi:hypothetical protein
MKGQRDRMEMPLLKLWEYWPWYLGLLMGLIGFFIALLVSTSAFLTFLIMFIFGLSFGRMWWTQRKGLRFSWAIVIIVFLVGYLLGARYGSIIQLLGVFLIGMLVVYYLHDKKIIKSAEY